MTIGHVHIDKEDVMSPDTDVIDLTANLADGAAATLVAEPTLRLVEDPQPLVL